MASWRRSRRRYIAGLASTRLWATSSARPPVTCFFATFLSDKDKSCYRRSSTYPHREPTMVKRCKNPSAAKRPPPARWERVRHTPRRATRGSPAPHSGAADDEAHRRPYRVARAEGLSAQRTRRIIAEMLAIDPTPGFFLHSQIARISVARTGERTIDEGG
jgi:hypothetical protein